ncbi:hypothetical protein AK830_g12310 [Neonectria ditissima]|uniref:Heterokaryon incompatibility domain-containing protein n=1 Tax=Neonectria ditissima TaxID=78410 RepID=A0A0P7B3L9_9HYPO|nr:hypothetical protein AK830_g12310 [Neonectria ditissima]
MSDVATLPACQWCWNLERGHLLVSAANLSNGTGSGCKSCSLLQEAISYFQPFAGVAQIAIIVDCALYVYVDNQLLIELFTDADFPVKWRNIGVARSPYPNFRSGPPVDLIRLWLSTCLREHFGCDLERERWLPTRVIDVGASEEDDIKLYVSRPRQAERYVALSHCWGDSSPVMTTTATLAAHRQGLSFGPETQTFADAVILTRLLGYRYLWIDALCIIQDDEADWAQEASKMKQTFGCAVVTFSADAADDPSGGLFPSMLDRATAHRTYPINTIGPYDEPVTVYARQRWSLPSDPQSAPHSALVPEPSRLETRAWALQERILSPRLLRFYKEEVVWSCRNFDGCECRLGPGASPGHGFRHIVNSNLRAMRSGWPSLVAEFTNKDLTYASDRLHAVSGVAALIAECDRSQYIAGLWLNDIVYSLMWISDYRRAKQPVTRVPDRRYAPSWSWASIDGPVVYIGRHIDQFGRRRSGQDLVQPLLKAVQASAMPVTRNIWGPVEKAFLAVRGQVLPVAFNATQQVWRPCPPPPRRGAAESLFHGGLSAWRMATMVAALPPVMPPRIEPTVIFDVPIEALERGEGGQPVKYAFLRAGRYIWGGSISTQSTEVVALLLVWAGEAAGVQAYRRRGIALHAFDSEEMWEGIPAQDLILC